MRQKVSCGVYIKAHEKNKKVINHGGRYFDATLEIYRAAVRFFLYVCSMEWSVISAVSADNERRNSLEKLTVTSKKRPAVKYDFRAESEAFRCMPCYLRRAAAADAVGIYAAYDTKHKQWLSAKKGGEPQLPEQPASFPMMYRGNMYRETDEELRAEIKVFDGSSWNWLLIDLRKTDVSYIRRHCARCSVSAPRLVRHGRRWKLVFTFERSVKLKETEVFDRTIAAVDLGINSAAAVSIMRSDGTLLGRRFSRLPCENDRLGHALGRIKKAQRHGSKSMPALWAAVNNINRGIARKTAAFIISTAQEFGCDVIVFEYLSFTGRKRGSRKQRLHLWKKSAVQEIVTSHAHSLGIHVSHVNAWGTSRLAFDGSGRVLRGSEIADGVPYSICRFTSGKTYNCDLNASYNIGARYFVREIIKSLPERAALALQAKVPACAKRSTCTLAVLISVGGVLSASC